MEKTNYNITTYYMKKAKNERRANLVKLSAKLLLICCFIFADYLFIYTLLEHYFCDAQWMSFIMSAVVACFVDVAPPIIILFAKSSESRGRKYIAVMLTVALVIMFTMLGYVRLHSADIIFSVNNTSLISSSSSGGVGDELSLSSGAMGMSWLFVFMPIATSILSAAVSIVLQPSHEYSDKYLKSRLSVRISDIDASEIEIDYVLNKDFDSDIDAKQELEFSNADAEMQITVDKLKLKQAIASKSPQAATEIFVRKTETE